MVILFQILYLRKGKLDQGNIRHDINSEALLEERAAAERIKLLAAR